MIQRIAKNADIKFCVSDNAITASLNTETSERKKADTTLTATATNLDTRLKNLENQENQTVWDFGTY